MLAEHPKQSAQASQQKTGDTDSRIARASPPLDGELGNPHHNGNGYRWGSAGRQPTRSALEPNTMTTIHCRYGGDLRCTAQHGPSATTLETDAPTDNQGKGERYSPTDLVATSLASCILTVMGIVANRHGWDLEGSSARVEKTMTSSGVRRIAQLEVWIELPASLDADAFRLLQRAGEGCPVKCSLEGSVPMALHWSQRPLN